MLILTSSFFIHNSSQGFTGNKEKQYPGVEGDPRNLPGPLKQKVPLYPLAVLEYSSYDIFRWLFANCFLTH